MEGSHHDAQIEFVIESDEATGTLTVAGTETIEFTLPVATGDAGVCWAQGTDEAPEARGDCVVFADCRQWGCICPPPAFSGPCCELGRYPAGPVGVRGSSGFQGIA